MLGSDVMLRPKQLKWWQKKKKKELGEWPQKKT